MKYNIFYLLITFLNFLCLHLIFAQEYTPGVNKEIFSKINVLVKTNINEDLEVTNIMNIDSSKGFELGAKWPEVGIIEDPNYYLKNCYVFLASRLDYSSNVDSIGGIIGIFKNENIIWHSDKMIKIDQYELLTSGYIWSVKDLNRDGNPEIMTTWLSKTSYDICPDGLKAPFLYLWIISWNGSEGTRLNDIDSTEISKIKISSNGIFRMADIEGDGIWEVQGYTCPVSSEDSLQINSENSLVLRTYYWDGKVYSKWLNTHQPLEDDYYPKDKIDYNVYSTVESFNDTIIYTYSLANLPSSIQAIEAMGLYVDIEPSNITTSNKCWGIVFRKDSSVIFIWTSKQIDCYNFIKPNQYINLFKLTTTKETLPGISKFYASGWNTNSFQYNEIFNNSKQNFTISPTNLPILVDGFKFIDTLQYFNQQSLTLGWIKSQQTAEKYSGYLTTAKTELQNNNVKAARTALESVLKDVDVDSSSAITSEAYALLRYNTEYLLSKLPTEEAPVPEINSLKPAYGIAGIKELTIEVKGSSFFNGANIQWNGSARSAIYISGSLLKVNLSAIDLSKPGSFNIVVKNPDGSISNSVVFNVVSRTAAIDTLIRIANALCNGCFKNKGICNSLTKKLENAGKDIEKNNLKAAKGKLNAFLNELNAQRGKGVCESGYVELKNYAEQILQSL